jgi:hypothetical protein
MACNVLRHMIMTSRNSLAQRLTHIRLAFAVPQVPIRFLNLECTANKELAFNKTLPMESQTIE